MWLLLADLHFSKSTIRDYDATLAWIEQQINHYTPDNIFILGDSLHTRSSVDVEALQFFDNFVRSIQERPENPYLHILVGNHDMSDRYTRQVNSMSIFANPEKRTTVYSEITRTTVDGHDCLFIPYHEDQAEIKRFLHGENGKDTTKDTIAFAHVALDGARVNGMNITTNVECSNSKLEAADFANCKHVFSGHYHHHASHGKNFTYVGSPMQFTFGDVGSTNRGGIVYDPQKNEWQLLVNPHAERYVEIDIGSEKRDITGKHVRCNPLSFGSVMSEEEIDRVKTSLYKQGAASVVVKALPVSVPTKVSAVTQCDILQLVSDFLDTDSAAVGGDKDLYRSFITSIIEDLDPWRSQARFDAEIRCVTVDNFLGVRGKLTFQFSKLEKGLWFIIGDNGAGKTTISDAITFALFDITSRDVAVSEIIHNGTSTCTVHVEFANGMSVTRRRQRSGQDLFVTMPDGRVIQKSSVKLTEMELHRIMNISWATFQRIAILNSNNMFQLFSTRDKNRTEVIENLIGLQILNQMTTNVTNKFQALNNALKVTSVELIAATDALSATTSAKLQCLQQTEQLQQRIDALDQHGSDLHKTITLDTERLHEAEAEAESTLAAVETRYSALLEHEKADLDSIQTELDRATSECMERSCEPPRLIEASVQRSEIRQRIDAAQHRKEHRGHLEAAHKTHLDRERQFTIDAQKIQALLTNETTRLAEVMEKTDVDLTALATELEKSIQTENQLVKNIQETIDDTVAERAKLQTLYASYAIDDVKSELASLEGLMNKENAMQSEIEKLQADLDASQMRYAQLLSEQKRIEDDDIIKTVICESRDFVAPYNDPVLSNGIKRTVEEPLSRFAQSGSDKRLVIIASALSTLDSTNKTVRHRMKQKGREVQGLLDSKAERKRRWDDGHKKLSSLKASKRDAQEALDSTQTKLQTLLWEKESVTRQYRSSQSTLRRTRDELLETKTQLLDQHTVSRLRDDLVRCETQRDEAKNAALKAQETLEDKNMLEQWIADDDETDALHRQLQQLDVEIYKLREEDATRLAELTKIHETIAQLREKRMNAIDSYREQGIVLLAETDRCTAALEVMRKEHDVLSKLKDELLRCETQRQEVEATMKDTRQVLDRLNTEIHGKEATATEKRTEHDTMKKELDILEYWKTNLGNTLRGKFRKFCVTRYVDILNAKLAENIALINTSNHLRCKIDENLRIITTSSSGVSFNQRSSGERKKTQLALLFAIINFMMSNSAFQNRMLFVDEIFDFLDSSGRIVVEEWIEQFSTRHGNMQTFIVTHMPVEDLSRAKGIIDIKRHSKASSSFAATSFCLGPVEFVK